MKDVTPLECSKMSSTKLNELVNLVKQKYKTDATLRKIFNPIKFLYYQNEEEYFKKITSRQLRQLVDKTLDRYSERTLKYIFSPVKPLFEEKETKKEKVEKKSFYMKYKNFTSFTKFKVKRCK